MTAETPRTDPAPRGRRRRNPEPVDDDFGILPTGHAETALPFDDDLTVEIAAVPASVGVAVEDHPATADHPTTVLEPIRDTPNYQPELPLQLPPEPPLDPRERIARRRAMEKRIRRRKIRRFALAGLAVVLAVVGFSIGEALAKPTTASTSAKLAEWGRDHHLGWLVTDLEKIQYKLNPPRTGGKLAHGIQVGTGTGPSALPSKPVVVKHGPPHTPVPANIPPIVKDGAYPNEGVWKPLVMGADNLPLVLGTAIRPDPVHTSYQMGIAWMDPKRARFELHPGLGEPAGTWSTSTSLGSAQAQKGLVAAFNAGFRLPNNASRGGWYLDGKWAYPAHTGAESFVIYKNGTATVGAWGTEIKPSAQIAAVRQNLDALLLPGPGGTPKINPTVDENDTPTWGYTLGSAVYVQRSAVGVTRSGAIVYAHGLTDTRTLAEVMRAAGCVRAMELDINPEWTIYNYFTRASGLTTKASTGAVTGHPLTPDESAGPDHFLATSARDFFAVYAR